MLKKRVALIYGGMSGEHSVSCLTAASVMRVINREIYEVVPIGIRRDGTWVPGENDPDALESQGAAAEVTSHEAQILLSTGGTRQLYALGADGAWENLGKIDVAFPLLHGPFGEDGTIQGMLEMAGIPYVGCGVFASASGMDKHYMKVVLESAHIPVAPYVVVTPGRWHLHREEVLNEVEERLSFPVFVKPARAGSSLGIVKANNREEVVEAIAQAQRTDPKVIVEQGVKGREIECAVVGGRGNDGARASVVGEIVMDGVDWYDFNTKYVQTEGFHMDIPAKVSPEVSERMRAMAVRVFDAFDCEGMTRVDFFLTDQGDVLVNEHNTIPGFTRFSMYPLLWEASGLSYPELVEELISLALDRPIGLR